MLLIQAELGLPTPRMRTRDRVDQALRRPRFFPLLSPNREDEGLTEWTWSDVTSTELPTPEKPDLTRILIGGVGAIGSVVDEEFTSLCVMDVSFSREAGEHASTKYKKCKGYEDNKKAPITGCFCKHIKFIPELFHRTILFQYLRQFLPRQ